MAAKPVKVLAPAKVNLALHVTGQRIDGYHLLESDVVFADENAADSIAVTASDKDSFNIVGPLAESLHTSDDNLVIHARDMTRILARKTGQDTPPVAITLDKQLPIASGIGGGSADAAATIKALMQHWGLVSLPGLEAETIALGADVPMCLAGAPLRASGIGENLEPQITPELPAVLVNPLKPVSTPSVFAALTKRDNPPLPASRENTSTFVSWLNDNTRNDLQQPAMSIEPAIADVLDAITASQPLLARMSGSGATCFGLYDTMDRSREAAAAIARSKPSWWVRATLLQGSKDGS